ncbi:MAG: hypothetical protein KBC41_01875 [Candidatus Pacebacteria bacterium]|nr:hypothetical protein [Candidatus Paceibacterota bacterium]
MSLLFFIASTPHLFFIASILHLFLPIVIYFRTLPSLKRDYLEGKNTLKVSISKLNTIFLIPLFIGIAFVLVSSFLVHKLNIINDNAMAIGFISIYLIISTFTLLPIVSTILTVIAYFKLKEFKENGGVDGKFSSALNMFTRYFFYFILLLIVSICIAFLIASQLN